MKNKISFPNFGNYHYPIQVFLKKIFKTDIIVPKKTTKNTLEIGAKNSPDFVCLPFKYNLGNFIESLKSGANILIQAGGGCRYGYYGEVQEAILKDLGYNFTFINLMENGSFSIHKFYKEAKKYNKKLNIFTYYYHVLVTLYNIYNMDLIDRFVRRNVKYELSDGILLNIKKSHYKRILDKYGFINSLKNYYTTKHMMKCNILKDESQDSNLKICLLGELYSLIEEEASYNIESYLLKNHIEVRRYTDLTYLLITKRFNEKKLKRKAKDYVKYNLGADGLDNVAHALEVIDEGFDGIIHMKPFSCSPEISAVPILQKISKDKNIPILFLTFDSQYAKGAIETRIEAFIDMLNMRKDRDKNE